MSKVPLYADFNKTAREILYGGKEGSYQFGNKITFTGKGSSGLNVGVTALSTTPSNIGLDISLNGTVAGLATSAVLSSLGKVSASVAKAELAPGLKLTASTVYPDLTGAGKLTTDYLAKNLTSRLVIASLSEPKVEASVATGHGKYVIGADASYDVNKGTLSKHSIGGAYLDGNVAVGAALLNLDQVKATVAYQLASDASVAAEVVHKLPQGETSFAVGGMRKIESGLYKAKIDSKGIVTALYGTALNKNARVEATVQFETLDTLGKNAKTGVALDVNYN